MSGHTQVTQKTTALLFWLTFLIAALLLSINADFQNYLAQGDHGRDLYAFKTTLEGGRPYHDYSWIFGPLMPYYYALFMGLFGVTIKSVVIGKLVLIWIAALFFYASLAAIGPPIFALIGSLWFLIYQQDFFYTYNHAGGITLLVINLYILIRYIQSGRIRDCFLVLLPVFLLCLTKINFGVCALVCSLCVIVVTDKIFGRKWTGAHIIFFMTALMILPVVVFLIYAVAVYGLPVYYIHQCFPYFGAAQPLHAPLLHTIGALIQSIVKAATFNLPAVMLSIITLLSFVQMLRTLFAPTTDTRYKHQLSLILMTLGLFYVSCLHEFLISGVVYRSQWALPFGIFAIFVVLPFGLKNVSKPIRIIFYGTILMMFTNILTTFLPRIYYKKTPDKFLDMDTARIYVGNPADWMETVRQTTDYLEAHLTEEETFLALPYDALYYYLMDRRAPVPLMIFFEYKNIPPEQEADIIQKLEEQRVNWILISSRMLSQDPGLGSFGQTHCPNLARYIDANFARQVVIGNWHDPAGHRTPHGTMILKRKESQ